MVRIEGRGKRQTMNPRNLWFLGISCLVIAGVLWQGCGFYGKKRGPTEWHRIQRVDFQQPPYAKYLQGLKFCLDPGHGGDAHIPNYKRGPTGVREAEMNLRVAFYLKEFLEQAGANVILTRDGDYDISLGDRAAIANRAQVDMFISLHHNDIDKPEVNYASTWYHGDADYSPVSLDLARYVQQSLVDILRLPNHLPTGLLSDYLMYPSGFGVLRYLQVPGILIESSFFSHPHEEKLLAKPAYNRLEAYALFLGIARWAAAGLPKVELIYPRPDSTITDKQPTIRLKVSDGLHERQGAWMLPREQIFSRHVVFFLDDSIAPHTFIPERNLILHTPGRLLFNGWHTVTAEIINYFGNHNLPRKWRFRCAPPAQQLLVSSPLFWLPADGSSLLPIETIAFDGDSCLVADDDTIYVFSDKGSIIQSWRLTKGGKTIHYLQADTLPGSVNLTIRAGKAIAHEQISLKDTNLTLIQGFVLSMTDSLPLPEARLDCLPDSLTCWSNKDGFFLFPNYFKPNRYSPTQSSVVVPPHPGGDRTLRASKPGFWTEEQELVSPEQEAGKSARVDFQLKPQYQGILHDFILVLDSGADFRESVNFMGVNTTIGQINLILAKMIQQIFQQAGAQVFLVRDNETNLTAAQRVARSNQFPAGGYYLKLTLNKWCRDKPLLSGGYYAGNETGRRIIVRLDSLLGTSNFSSKSQIRTSNSYEIINTNRAALSIDLNILGAPATTADLSNIAYQIFYSFLWEISQHQLVDNQLEIRVDHNDSPLSGTKLIFQYQLEAYTDSTGAFTWHYLDRRDYKIFLYHPVYGTKSLSINLDEQVKSVKITLP